MADIITLENALTNVRYNIESLTGTLNKYDALIAYSTVTVTLNEVYDYSKEVNPSDPLLTRLLQRLKDSWKALIDFGEFLLLALVTVLPFIVIPVIIIIIIFIVRNKRKSKKQKDEGSKN
ncbi:hypothetical protein SDC9_138485 [bioreactor metagenome]|uniref:DUF4349 domain-containing protein n=1 Tax=bioreactor metagenome TaxID=1076179 RepID=A0A645DPV2_9ZZZZ